MSDQDEFNTFLYPFSRRWILYLLAALIFCVVKLIPIETISSQAHSTLAVFSVAAFLWITSALPLAITGIVVLLLLPLTGAVSAEQTYSYFGNDAVFFVLGALILASPMMRSGLSTRMALAIINRFGRGPFGLLSSIFLLSCCLSFVISEHAVAAMLLPIIMEIVTSTGEKAGSRFGLAAFLAMGWGACIGGTATLLGGARAPLALGILQNTTGKSITFSEWVVYAFPGVVCLAIIGLIILAFIAGRSNVNIRAARAQLELHQSTMGPLSSRELYTLFVLLLTIVLWIFFGSGWGLDVIAFLGVILAFALRITNWKEVEHDVQWSIFIMYGSAIALGAALRDTGAASGLVHMLIGTGLNSPVWIFVLLIGLAFILTEAMSNAAAVAVLLPIGLALSSQFGIDPKVITVGVATAAGMTFLLPVSTPAMAIITSTTYAQPHRVFRAGLLLKFLSFFVILGLAFIYWPMLGQHGY